MTDPAAHPATPRTPGPAGRRRFQAPPPTGEGGADFPPTRPTGPTIARSGPGPIPTPAGAFL